MYIDMKKRLMLMLSCTAYDDGICKNREVRRNKANQQQKAFCTIATFDFAADERAADFALLHVVPAFDAATDLHMPNT